MNPVVKKRKKPRMMYLAFHGYFSDILDYVQTVENELQARLAFSKIEPGKALEDEYAESEEDDELQAVIHILDHGGDAIDVVLKLLKTSRYQWITIDDQGEVQKNGDSEREERV